MTVPVRTRYAPSPTGVPHVGNIRTALFDYLLARHFGGQFILRIEDTDRARSVPGAVEAIHGPTAFDLATIDDFVLLKSDGYPVYALAYIVDDETMKISHVLRGDEWLPSAPRHLLVYRALGIDPPVIAHLPRILGPDGSKLSKRHGA